MLDSLLVKIYEIQKKVEQKEMFDLQGEFDIIALQNLLNASDTLIKEGNKKCQLIDCLQENINLQMKQ